ncbi:PSG9 isoform 5, partial [Pongo abelii]
VLGGVYLAFREESGNIFIPACVPWAQANPKFSFRTLQI